MGGPEIAGPGNPCALFPRVLRCDRVSPEFLSPEFPIPYPVPGTPVGALYGLSQTVFSPRCKALGYLNMGRIETAEFRSSGGEKPLIIPPPRIAS